MISDYPTDEDIERSAIDSAYWAGCALGVKPWGKQIEILESIRVNSETAVKSCHSAGKDWTAALAVLWFLYNHFPSIVITTAPTDRQVRGILWREIGMMHRKSQWPLSGRLLTQELKIDRNWTAWGFTAPDFDPDKFQGFHAPNILVVLDEASGIGELIYEAIDGILSGGHARRLEIGNPTDPLSPFAKSFKTPGIKKFSISAFDTPNFTAFGITQKDIEQGTWEKKIKGDLPAPYLITPEWAAKVWQRNGTSSAYYQSRVLAQFPAEGQDTLIPLAWIEAAQNREVKPTAPHVLSLDVGRGGDSSIIGERKGPHYRTLQRLDCRNTMEVAGHLAKALEDTKAESAKIDVVGIGAGVVDRGQELGLPFEAANAGAKSLDPERYVNARAEWNWNLRERFQDGDIDLDPADEALTEQLSAIKWKPDSRGRVAIESKDEMKRRLGRSPDEADAMAIAFANLDAHEDWSFA